jgi:hypothetical protein
LLTARVVWINWRPRTEQPDTWSVRRCRLYYSDSYKNQRPIPREPRDDRADRNVNDSRVFAVAHTLEIAQYDGLPMFDGLGAGRLARRVNAVATHGKVLRVAACIIGRTVKPLFTVQGVVVGGAVGHLAPSLPFGEPGVAPNREHPSARIVAMEAVEGTDCTQIGVLDHIFGIPDAPRPPAREVGCCLEMRRGCWVLFAGGPALEHRGALLSSSSRRIGAFRSRTANLQADRLLDLWHAVLAYTEVARNLFQLRTEENRCE